MIGDLNSRRGLIQAMDERAGVRVVKALVPLSEMFGYVTTLRSLTQTPMQVTVPAQQPPTTAVATTQALQWLTQHLPPAQP